jgi:hypothetical protein
MTPRRALTTSCNAQNAPPAVPALFSAGRAGAATRGCPQPVQGRRSHVSVHLENGARAPVQSLWPVSKANWILAADLVYSAWLGDESGVILEPILRLEARIGFSVTTAPPARQQAYGRRGGHGFCGRKVCASPHGARSRPPCAAAWRRPCWPASRSSCCTRSPIEATSPDRQPQPGGSSVQAALAGASGWCPDGRATAGVKAGARMIFIVGAGSGNAASRTHVLPSGASPSGENPRVA